MKNNILDKLKYLIVPILILVAMCVLNNKDAIIYIGSNKLVLTNDNVNIDLETFNSEFDTIIESKNIFHKVIVNGKKVKRKENLGKLKINRDAILEIEVKKLFFPTKKYTINLLPSMFPGYTVKGKSNYDGDYYTSTYSFDYDLNHYIFKLNEDGEIVFYKKTDMVSFDFRKVSNKNNEIRYLYLEAYANDFDGATSLLPCHLVILDENYKEIDRITHLESNDKMLKLENHGYMYIDDNHYILTAYDTMTDSVAGQEFNVYNCVIQEIKDGKILWEFNSKDYKELYNYSTLENLNYSNKYQDYIHFNSMDIDLSDGNLICSFRNIDSILKINRKNGDLMWKLGGVGDEFNLLENAKTSKQHSAISIGNNKILLYDNGNAKKRSRVVQYTLDEKNMKLVNFEEYDLGVYAFMMGSVRVIDEEKGIYLLCYGGSDYEKSSIQEINLETGQVYFEFTFDNIKSMYNVNKYQ